LREQWWLIREQWWLMREQWWLMRKQWWLFEAAVVAHEGAVVAHEVAVAAHQGSSGGSLVVTPDCDITVLSSNPAISITYSGLPVLRWAAIWDGTSL
jgi:hypothetical protein